MFEAIVGLSALILMEIVLGIDNILFVAILADKLPREKQARARVVGLSAALVLRVAFLFAITWLMGLSKSLFTLLGHAVSLRDLILLGGGLFLIAKSTLEIIEKIEHPGESERKAKKRATMAGVVMQIVLLDLVFSVDSVLTAVGMVKELWKMVTAVVIAMFFMILFAGKVARFVNEHPSVKVLGLSFLILIGVLLMADGLGQHISRGYVYFAMFFSLAVELVNMRVRSRASHS